MGVSIDERFIVLLFADDITESCVAVCDFAVLAVLLFALVDDVLLLSLISIVLPLLATSSNADEDCSKTTASAVPVFV